MTAWQMRTARLDDLDALVVLENRLFPSDAWSRGMLRDGIRDAHSTYLIVHPHGDETTVIGYGGVQAVGDQSDIQTIAIVPEFRRRGIGRALLQQLMAEARERGAETVFLEVRADNPNAQALYRSLGYEQIGVRPRYYQPDDVDALVMRAPLVAPQPALAVGAEVLAEDATTTDARARAARDDAPRIREPLILGIETSCDETGVGIVRGSTLLANAVASSMDEHARYGGVVPEIAARAHLESMQPTIEKALADAGVTLEEIDAIAVTAGPGLSGALMVGVASASALAVAAGLPLYGVNHLVGHVAADVLREDAPGALEGPTVALLVSGGHTSLLLAEDLVSRVELLGETIDDAAGEAFDKVARLLGLGYPGGPAIDRVAAEGDPQAIRFPRGLSLPKDLIAHRYDFSFSGLKTAVARWVEQRRSAGEQIPVADVAASFREAVADILTAKAVAACRDRGVTRMLLAGGVAANARVRELAAERCAAAGIELRIPPLSLCTDNGAMIAALGAQLVTAGRVPSRLGFGADSSLPVTEVMVG